MSAAGISVQLTRPRAIVFDWDNTLVDSWGTIHDALAHTFPDGGDGSRTALDPRQSRRAGPHRSLAESFPASSSAIRWQEAQQIYLDRFRAIHLERLTPLPGRADMLRELAADGHYLAVVSNKTGAVLRNEAAHLGWSPLFGSIVGAGRRRTPINPTARRSSWPWNGRAASSRVRTSGLSAIPQLTWSARSPCGLPRRYCWDMSVSRIEPGLATVPRRTLRSADRPSPVPPYAGPCDRASPPLTFVR